MKKKKKKRVFIPMLLLFMSKLLSLVSLEINVDVCWSEESLLFSDLP